MKILSRIFTVCLLLSGLAYGSYAFGKYVLSTKLFGQAVGAVARTRPVDTHTPKMAESMTRHVEYKSDKPHVEVQVLPAQDADPGPEPPPLSATERHSHPSDGASGTTASSKGPTSYDTTNKDHTGDKIVTPNDPAFNDSTPNFYGDGEQTTDKRPRRRHRKKKQAADATTQANAGADGATDTTTSGDSGTDPGASREVSGVGSDDSSSGHSTHRTATGDDTGSSSSDRHITSRHHRHESAGGDESPIPRPEGESTHSDHSSGSSGGSESPIPQPE